jgi:hypothetical protein
MDHLHIPEGCRPYARNVPYMGLAPKYDQLGFDSFPERHDVNSDILISSHSILQWRADWIESFIQEWLWFGLMDEFAKACNISIDLDDFITESSSSSGKILATGSLYDVYARRVAIRKLDQYAVSMGLEMGDLFRLPYEPSKTAVVQIVEFWTSKIQQNPLTAERVTEGLTILSNIDNNSADQEVNGKKVPLDILIERIIACRVLMSQFLPTPDHNGPTGGRVKLAETIARAQEAIGVIMMQHDPVIRFDIILSIDILCHTVAKVAGVILNERIPLRSPGFLENFEAAMKARNWCPSRISSIANSGNTPLSYISSLLPSYNTVPHHCNPRKCLTRPLAVEAMTGDHRRDCNGDCPVVTVNEHLTIDIWKAGGIPGLPTHQVNGHQLKEVEVVDCNNRPFVAISHVWSHGLGNSSENELPSCQVDFLYKSVRKVAGDDAILWIDTLSVPIEQSAKRIAISKLRKVYTDASKVLVIDRDLMQVGSDQIERILQLLSSEWQRRLWTLQEGRLARDLFIQFKDGAVPVSELMATAPVTQVGKSNAEIFDFFSLLKENLRLRFSGEYKDPLRFQAIVEDLAPRSVTVKSDEPICLATLLGLELEEFHPYPTMVDIYRSFPKIPQDLMFLIQPRLQVPGLTWAPSTFLETEFVSFRNNSASALGQLSVEGLHVVKDCLLFDEDLDFHRDPNSRPEIYIINTPNEGTFGIRSQNFHSSDGTFTQIESSRLILKPAIIWELSASKFGRAPKAVLVSRLHEKDGTTYCKFEMGLDGWPVGEGNKNFHQAMLNNSGRILGHFSANFVAEKSFCVG